MSFLSNYLLNWLTLRCGRQPRRPLLFSYYITHRCPHNCCYCSDGEGRRFKEDAVRELSTDQACRLLDILRPAAGTLDITGGEPMVREDLEDILAHARQLGFRTVLNTKGLGLEERPELLCLTDVLVLGLDALDAGPLAEVMGQSAEMAERALGALRFAMAHRRKSGTRLVLSAVATPGNLAQVTDIMHFAAENHLGFHLSPWIVGTTVHPALRGNPQYLHLIDEIIAVKRGGRGILGVRPYLEGLRDFRPFSCHPFLMPTIRPDGWMYYPCLELGQAPFDLLATGGYYQALDEARRTVGEVPECGNGCHLFCHMGLSLYQRHPLAALGELRHWRD